MARLITDQGLPIEVRPDSRVCYQDEDGILLCGDARHLFEIPSASIDLVIADPPFNLGFNYGAGISDRLTEAEYGEFTRRWWDEAQRVLTPGGQLFAIMPEHLHALWRPLAPKNSRVLHWIKTFTSHLHNGPSYLSAWEPILWVVHGKSPNVFWRPMRYYTDTDWFVGPNAAGESRLTPEMREHPAPRPSWLFEQFIMRATKPGDVILDPMVGVGSSVVAARRLGRRFIGVDLNPRYLELTASRLHRTDVDPTRFDPATNGALASGETLGWAVGNYRHFLPFADRNDKDIWGRFGPGYLAVPTEVLSKQLGKWGYDEAVVRPQWDQDGLLIRGKRKRTLVVRLGKRIDRCVLFRL